MLELWWKNNYYYRRTIFVLSDDKRTNRLLTTLRTHTHLFMYKQNPHTVTFIFLFDMTQGNKILSGPNSL